MTEITLNLQCNKTLVALIQSKYIMNPLKFVNEIYLQRETNFEHSNSLGDDWLV